ncbi:MAG: diaminopimelate epimerase [Gemmatimonadales bacterium]|nr:diaminopimelate epimerase [Gemmatimonadales bacterium]NIN11980.1 diaminopimelate epimerase [Gemmatimonadales bacterium]NIN50515.1 diaminopimelate epimerase [Gemmatimonadales bacterium]NIP07979.1 diaminopimelate epimerase [Gemmatimonadales bacterium]NIR00570.1 diaminopimelate epimerase [Gemmatimonadales bacterium]
MLDGTVIYKMSGSGNDFVVVDGRSEPIEVWTPERIRAICARGTGVGADGFVVLEPGSKPDAVRFHFFNSDGSRAPMCGNGALCAARLACWLELAPADGMTLETDAGPVAARCLPGDEERAELSLPSPGEITSPDIPLEAGERSVHLTTVGVPHVVVLVEDLASVPLPERGRELRSHAALAPAGANINFVANGHRGWAMRTYERGVEAETLACGTGAVASAAVLAHAGVASLPLDVCTASGALLTVSADLAATGAVKDPRLAGQARLVFRAVLGA